ncbi:MAG: aminopeptidase [Acidobacteria bacterium]|nr:aminopeptidase [Acidobacteriota bacterium]
MRRIVIVLLLLAATPLFAFDRQSNADYRSRRERLAAKLGKGTLVLFASTESEGPNALHGFRQNDDFFYLTGWREPGAALVVAANPYREILFLPAHNLSQEKWTGPKLGADSSDAASATGFERVDVLDHLRDELVKILPSPVAQVYTDLSDSGETASTIPIAWLRRANAFPNYISFADAKTPIAELRLIKDAGELTLLRKACDATVEAHKAAMRAVKPGVSEGEISALMQYEFQRRGCEMPSYSPIVGSGFNSTVLHYSANGGTMKSGDLVVMDVGGEYSMYAADVTRTLPVNGHFTDRQREIYDIVLGAQQAAVDAFVAGTSTIKGGDHALYRVAQEYINTHGKDLHGEPLAKYFIHGLGHYVGLAVHDVGSYAGALQPGTVFTIEPGIYIPEESLGVRIEDQYLVGEDGKLVCLTCAIPKKAEEVERAMAKK